MNVFTLDDAALDDWAFPGHGTGALGPSDSSDTGSDITGLALGDEDVLVEREKSDPSADDTVINYPAPQRRIGI